MRVAAWVFIVCTVIAGVTLFRPAIEAGHAGTSLFKRTELSLYQASHDRQLIRRMIAAYHRSGPRKLGDRLVHELSPHADRKLSGRARDAFDDARDAMDTLDGVSDDDVRLATTVFTITLWSFVGVSALLVLLVFGAAMSERFSRGRLIFVLLAAGLTAAVAVGFHLGCREAVWEANDEVGHIVTSLALAAYALPIASLLALFAAIVLLARRPR